MPRVIHFEIHADDPPRAVKFYSELLGWEFTKWAGPHDYWLIKTGDAKEPGIDGGLFKRMGPAPVEGQAVNAYVCTVDVKNLEQYVSKVGNLGGKIVVPKMPIPGVGWLTYAHDTEGNIFGMMQPDTNAK